MIETITEEQLTPQQAEFWVRARQAVDMNNYPYAVSLLKALVKQLPGFLEGRKALRACEIKLNPEAKRGGLFSGMKISTSKLTSSKKDAATQLSALEDELENDPYSIPVNEAVAFHHFNASFFLAGQNQQRLLKSFAGFALHFGIPFDIF